MPCIMNAGFVTTGLLMVLFSYSVYVLIGKSIPGVIGSGLIVAAGISFISMGFFSCDAGCLPLTLPGRIHLQVGLFASVAAVAAMFLLGYSMRRTGTWNRYWQFSVVNGVLDLLILPVFVFSGNSDGLLQRVMVGIIFLWMEVLAIRFIYACRKQVN
jgi:predicted permease